ncbi:MAG: type I-E CRISPR-associated protein Cas5/CasD, partial [Bacteroidota bacterium]
TYGDQPGFYDDYPSELSFGLMFHGFDYPDELGKDELHSRFWRPKMVKGVVDFIRPEQCTIRKFVREMAARPPESIGLEEEELLEGYEERR